MAQAYTDRPSKALLIADLLSPGEVWSQQETLWVLKSEHKIREQKVGYQEGF